MRSFDISTMNRLRTDSFKLIIVDGRWMSVRAGGKHPFGGLQRVSLLTTRMTMVGGVVMMMEIQSRCVLIGSLRERERLRETTVYPP
jgi:hypothetical protein